MNKETILKLVFFFTEEAEHHLREGALALPRLLVDGVVDRHRGAAAPRHVHVQQPRPPALAALGVLRVLGLDQPRHLDEGCAALRARAALPSILIEQV